MSDPALTNTPAMETALAWYRAHHLGHRQTTPHQIKIGKVSYWPAKGGIFVDKEAHLRPGNGLVALAAVLRELHLLPDHGVVARPTRPTRR